MRRSPRLAVELAVVLVVVIESDLEVVGQRGGLASGLSEVPAIAWISSSRNATASPLVRSSPRTIQIVPRRIICVILM